jgi:hypothetical protein
VRRDPSTRFFCSIRPPGFFVPESLNSEVWERALVLARRHSAKLGMRTPIFSRWQARSLLGQMLSIHSTSVSANSPRPKSFDFCQGE